MSIIIADHISIDFPIYGSRSIKNTFISGMTGGKIRKGEKTQIVRALDNISFNFEDGDRVGLLGHNGSGKTTLLRAIAEIYRPSEGTLTINGSVMSLLNINVGSEAEATGLENIYMRAAVMGYSKKKIQPKVKEILDFADIGDFINLPLRTYSSGMQLRVKFAVSTSVYSDVVLLDEWLSVGDKDFVNKASERLNDLISHSKVMVIASHNREFLETICNRIITLEHGKIIKEERI